MNLVIRFLKSKNKKMILEALYYSAKYRYHLLYRPLKSFADKLGEQGEEEYSYSDNDIEMVNDVRDTVNRVCNNTPWKSECLVRVFVAKRMLYHRNVHSNAYLGVKKDKEGNLLAHAWIKCGDIFVSGKDGYEEFTVTSVFHS